jgi:hypothetical protein
MKARVRAVVAASGGAIVAPEARAEAATTARQNNLLL